MSYGECRMKRMRQNLQQEFAKCSLKDVFQHVLSCYSPSPGSPIADSSRRTGGGGGGAVR